MIRRVGRDDAGAALGLAVVLVVLLGVMAAGLLAVVRADLESVVSANRGQAALELADAGARAAAANLRADPNPGRYDADAADNADWARDAPDGASGRTLSPGPGTARVTILYLVPARTPQEQRDGRHAPEPVPEGLSDYPDRDFFLVVSEGSVHDARRKVEVILCVTETAGGHEVSQWSWREAYE